MRSKHVIQLAVLFRPTDLHLIKQKIESGEIRSWSQMKREVILMIINFNMFFPHGHPMHTAAEDYYNDINHQFDVRHLLLRKISNYENVTQFF